MLVAPRRELRYSPLAKSRLANLARISEALHEAASAEIFNLYTLYEAAESVGGDPCIWVSTYSVGRFDISYSIGLATFLIVDVEVRDTEDGVPPNPAHGIFVRSVEGKLQRYVLDEDAPLQFVDNRDRMFLFYLLDGRRTAGTRMDFTMNKPVLLIIDGGHSMSALWASLPVGDIDVIDALLLRDVYNVCKAIYGFAEFFALEEEARFISARDPSLDIATILLGVNIVDRTMMIDFNNRLSTQVIGGLGFTLGTIRESFVDDAHNSTGIAYAAAAARWRADALERCHAIGDGLELAYARLIPPKDGEAERGPDERHIDE
jgi:hypothetical protein